MGLAMLRLAPLQGQTVVVEVAAFDIAVRVLVVAVTPMQSCPLPAVTVEVLTLAEAVRSGRERSKRGVVCGTMAVELSFSFSWLGFSYGTARWLSVH